MSYNLGWREKLLPVLSVPLLQEQWKDYLTLTSVEQIQHNHLIML